MLAYAEQPIFFSASLAKDCTTLMPESESSTRSLTAAISFFERATVRLFHPTREVEGIDHRHRRQQRG